MDFMYTIPAVIGLGVLHSLEPGHGKGVITAYLISSGARIRDAVLLGLISAFSHTLSIALLAFSASSTIKAVFPRYLTSWFQLVSGFIILYIGLNILYDRFMSPKERRNHAHSSPEKHGAACCPHEHCNHDHCDHHHPGPFIKTSSPLLNLFLMGFFTGLIPCPSALAILLAAVSADKIPLGLSLVACFSIGSAITMVTVGVLVVRVGGAFSRLEKWNVVNRLALASSFLILFLGGALILQSISHFGMVPAVNH